MREQWEDLSGTLEQEKARIGIFITLREATRDMKTAAADAGFYHSPAWNRDYPRIQIITVEQLMNGQKPDLPPVNRTFRHAERDIREKDRWKQDELPG